MRLIDKQLQKLGITLDEAREQISLACARWLFPVTTADDTDWDVKTPLWGFIERRDSETPLDAVCRMQRFRMYYDIREVQLDEATVNRINAGEDCLDCENCLYSNHKDDNEICRRKFGKKIFVSEAEIISHHEERKRLTGKRYFQSLTPEDRARSEDVFTNDWWYRLPTSGCPD